MPGNWHARFCSRGEESDFLIDCNPDRRHVADRSEQQRCGLAAAGDWRALGRVSVKSDNVMTCQTTEMREADRIFSA